jgi:hypothetical protein
MEVQLSNQKDVVTPSPTLTVEIDRIKGTRDA